MILAIRLLPAHRYNMHYLEGHFDAALGTLTSLIAPNHPYKSVYDFCNPELFHACLLRMSHPPHSASQISPNSPPTQKPSACPPSSTREIPACRAMSSSG